MIIYELFEGNKFYFKGWLIGEPVYTQTISEATDYTPEDCTMVIKKLGDMYPVRTFKQLTP
jgi:hypothetical protein